MTTNNAINTPQLTTNGQLYIGNTGTIPSASTLTPGNGITVTNGSGTITLASTGNSPWTDVTGTSQSMASNNGYIADNSSLVTLTIPTTFAVGDMIRVQGKGSGGWSIVLNSGQTIHFGSSTTTTTTGNLASTNQYDSITLVGITANTTMAVLASIGNITVV